MSNTLGPEMSSKIVNFDFESDKIILSKLNALPSIVRSVHERSQIALIEKLKVYFDHVDDALFESADKAFSSQEQNVFFDAMRELRVQRPGIEKRFVAAVSHAFIDLLHPHNSTESASIEAFSCDALSLVGNDDLEEMVALDTSVAKANNHYGESIQHISLRLDSLLPIKIYQKNNPLGPDVLCRIFMEQVKRLDIDLKAKLIVFKLFDRVLISELGSLYKSINAFLIDSNILPSLSVASSRQQHRSARVDSSVESRFDEPRVVPASVGHSGKPDAGLSHVHTAARTSGMSNDVIGMLHTILNDSVRQPDSSSAVAALSKIQASLVELNNDTIHNHTDKPEQFNSYALVDRIHLLNGEHGKIGSSESQIIELVAMLFDFVLDDPLLHSQLKSLIIKLQIPLTKLALIDKAFLIDGNHVARKLLNVMTQAALSCEFGHTRGKLDPLYCKIDHVIAMLLTQFDADTAVFEQALNEFEEFKDKEERRAKILEKRTLDAEDGKAKAEVARMTIAIETELRLVDKKLPKVAVVIIEKAWRNYLFITALKYGFNTLQWRSALSTMDNLIISVQPLKNDTQRSNLIHLAPDLLKKLQFGFDAISYNPYEAAKILKVLEHVHLKLIRGKEVDVFTPLRSASIKRHKVKHGAPAENEGALVESEGLARIDSETKHNAAQPEKDESALPVLTQAELESVNAFSQGAWFEMHINDTTITRCRLAAFIKATDKYIFVNRNGMKVTEKTKVELALAIKNNKVREINNTVLFDRALEAVVSSMRKKKKTS